MIADNIGALMSYCDDFFKTMNEKIAKIEKTLERNQNDLEAIATMLENKNKIKE
jgi:ABC-type transporter Mla subunit MlaD